MDEDEWTPSGRDHDDSASTGPTDYFVEFLLAYERAGVPVYAVTTQNEPQNRNPSGYPGMYMSAGQQARFIAELGPALLCAGLDTKILAYDHNWSMHPGDIESTPPGETPETEYPSLVLADDEAAPWIDGVAYHCYFGDPARQTELHRAFDDVDVYFTECSGSHGPTDPPAQVFPDTLKWHARNLIVGVTRNWSRKASTGTWPGSVAVRQRGRCDTCTASSPSAPARP